jgi:hypothetical protein
MGISSSFLAATVPLNSLNYPVTFLVVHASDVKLASAGIPKFFRWLSERYPLINQSVAANGFMPGFDNLYLDMNGIMRTTMTFHSA